MELLAKLKVRSSKLLTPRPATSPFGLQRSPALTVQLEDKDDDKDDIPGWYSVFGRECSNHAVGCTFGLQRSLCS